MGRVGVVLGRRLQAGLHPVRRLTQSAVSQQIAALEADLGDARWIDAPEVANSVADLRVMTGIFGS
ncbi:helix-turn-helix domain-containing protein [Candidatus Frankia alpina]|uniref:helix-turn-helix domain-containing protein n=1 Tax=Candidatus Frankia alpina TaxID=2699483 RepID=UPI001386D9F4|nr:LysR family transcriptional regulator [Candidatus Frankia alpina]